MVATYTIESIGVIRTCFTEKFGVPRQALLAPSVTGQLIISSPFNSPDCFDGIEASSHLWLSFIFHQHVGQGWKAKVRPPRLGGNKKIGVFATRSSYRPNALGLSVVKLDSVERKPKELILNLSGLDMIDGTPVVDIKPYIPYADALADASNELANVRPIIRPVIFSETAEDFLTRNHCLELKILLTEVLQQDPRPAYQATELGRLYKMTLKGFNIHWRATSLNDELIIEVMAID